MGERRGKFKWVILVFAIATVFIAVLTPVVVAPIATGSWLMRTSMTAIDGMEKTSLTAPSGPVTVFVGGPETGEPIVLIHGLEDHAGTWWKTAPLLMERGYRVIAFDQAGHGESGPKQGEIGVGDLIDVVTVVVERHAPEKNVTLMGNSLGGAVALGWALQNQDRVRQLILLDSAGMKFEPNVRRFIPETIDDMRTTVRAVIGENNPQPPDFFLRDMMISIRNGATPRLWPSLSTAPALEPLLPSLRVPTVVIWGEDDGLLPIAMGKKMAQLIPGATFTGLPSCGHSPQVLCPDAFHPVLLRALEAQRD